MEGGAVGHNFEMGLHKEYPTRFGGCNLIQRFQRKRFKCDLICIIGINRLKEKFHRKARNIYMLNYSLPCSCS